MPKRDDDDDELCVFHRVDNSVISNPNPKKVCRTYDFLGLGGVRFVPKSFGGENNSLSFRRVQLFECFECFGENENFKTLSQA